MVKYLLFDLDGTLTDPKEGITKCFQYALEAFGIAPPAADELTWVIGPPLMESFMQGCGFSEERAKEATAKYRERYEPVGWQENQAYPGIADELARLREAGFVLALATSKPEHMAERILEHFGLADYFEVIGGASRDLSRTRKEEVLRYTLDRLGVEDMDEVLMIGDRKYDVEGAGQLGIPCLGVTWGYGSREELEKAGATAIAGSVREMADYCLSLII
ncbi:MAG: HAD family hydrolase [Lachnospiraceae bacterium]|nr:HAD family hydrolase [Lachnospiraceae bacterium]